MTRVSEQEPDECRNLKAAYVIVPSASVRRAAHPRLGESRIDCERMSTPDSRVSKSQDSQQQQIRKLKEMLAQNEELNARMRELIKDLENTTSRSRDKDRSQDAPD